MNVEEFFNSLVEINSLSAEQRELIDKMMSLETPMSFDDDFATDEELDALENIMDAAEREAPSYITLKEVISQLPAQISNKDDDFI